MVMTADTTTTTTTTKESLKQLRISDVMLWVITLSIMALLVFAYIEISESQLYIVQLETTIQSQFEYEQCMIDYIMTGTLTTTYEEMKLLCR